MRTAGSRALAHTRPPGSRRPQKCFSTQLLLLHPSRSRKLYGYFFGGRVITAEIFPRKQAPACSRLLWLWWELFCLFGCYSNQKTALTLNRPSASVPRRAKRKSWLLHPLPHPLSLFIFFWIPVFSSFIWKLACNSVNIKLVRVWCQGLSIG